MKSYLQIIVAAAALAALPGMALAQVDPHHPEAGGSAPSAPPAATAPGSSDQPAAMMQMMQQMMPMMQQMMGMMQGMGGQMQPPAGTPGHGMGAAAMPTGMSDASKAYMDAMKQMDTPMMEAIKAQDPDVAFVSGMIPHHQGAIDMARAVLKYGKDEKVKTWAGQIIKAQEAEIAEMQAWLKEHQ